jgi:hypothetical protein
MVRRILGLSQRDLGAGRGAAMWCPARLGIGIFVDLIWMDCTGMCSTHLTSRA